MKWSVSIIKVANAGVHKELRITCAMPQEFGKEFVKACWPTEDQPIFAELELTTEGLKAGSPAHGTSLDKPLETTPVPAGVHNPYSRRAGILASDSDYHNFIRAPGEDRATFAASYIRHVCKVASRKEILPGTEAARLFDREYADFIVWRDGPKHGAAA